MHAYTEFGNLVSLHKTIIIDNEVNIDAINIRAT